MESKKNKLSQEIFATESIWRLMAKMCVPAVLTILIMVLYNMADIYFIGQTGDSYKVTALSLCMPITTVLSALGSMVGTGASSCISIAMGRGDTSRVHAFSSFSFYFSLLLGAAYAIIIYIFMSPILDLLGTSSIPETLPSLICSLSCWALRWLWSTPAWVRSSGRRERPPSPWSEI